MIVDLYSRYESGKIIEKMNSLLFELIFVILVPQIILFENSRNISYSICWISKGDALDRQNPDIWLNGAALQSIGKVGITTSLKVSPVVENNLTLHYGGVAKEWNFRIHQNSNLIEIKDQQRPLEQPTDTTKGFLEMFTPTEVFACENGTAFFHQDENFLFAIGHTERLPVELQSRTSSMLLVSWVESLPSVSNDSHTTILYHILLDSYETLRIERTTNNHYTFTHLGSCSPHVACVEIAGYHSITCLSALTDPEDPKDFVVTSWNTSSISLSWDCPEHCWSSLFLLTVFYLNGSEQVTEEVRMWHKEDNLVFTLSDLQPCTKVKFGLQTVCQAGMAYSYSNMVLNDGNSAHSNIESLCQTSFGPDNYTLSWELGSTSSISMFRVYHEGELQGTTLITNYTVHGLLPCKQYKAKVEALCGESVVMSVKTHTAHTGPHGVSELKYRSNDSTALWHPSSTHNSAMAFLYELSLNNGSTLESSRLSYPELHLPGLEEGKTYILDVWEECEGQWKSESSHVCFEGTNSSLEFLMRAAGPGLDQELDLDISSLGLTIIVPWSLPEELQDGMLEPRATAEKIYKNKLQDLLKDFNQPIRMELATLGPAYDPHKTEMVFMSFNASRTEDVPLPVEDLLDYIHSLNADNISVTDWVIQWEGPDLCASSSKPACPRNSLCINTLGSYTCVCRHGYYDVSSISKTPAASYPACNEKGLFSHCLDKLVTGGIAKTYLASLMGEKFDVKLNDGRCHVEEKEIFYYFTTSRKASQCGTERQVNKTHIEYRNTLSVTLSKEQTISRRDIKVVWKCIYPRQYVRNTQVGVDMGWHTNLSLMEVSSSQQLGLTMTLYTDLSYNYSYSNALSLEPEDTMFLQVALQTNNSYASDTLLRVETCWATESTDPQDMVQGVLLQDGCPVDNTFQWLSVNGMDKTSKFSIQMFRMPHSLPLYLHCLTSICGHHEDCVKNCTDQPQSSRLESDTDRKEIQAGVVSAGPLLFTRKVPSHWPENMTMVFIVAGSIGFLGLTVLSIGSVKAVMTCFEHLRQK